jgi:MYXO-CTERM domain-containing protein
MVQLLHEGTQPTSIIMKKAVKLAGIITMTAFLAFTSPAVSAQATTDNTATTVTTDDMDDDEDDDSNWGLAGLLGLLGLLGLRRNDTRRTTTVHRDDDLNRTSTTVR